MKCSDCDSQGIKIQPADNVGLCCEMNLYCESCGFVKTSCVHRNCQAVKIYMILMLG